MHGEWIGIARAVGLDWLRPHWFPWQGGGAPIEYLYTPLVPFVLAMGDAPRVLNALTAVIYVFGPTLVFIVGWRLLQSPLAGFIAALCYALFSPTELFLPDAAWRSVMTLSARRFYLLWEWDELPHLIAATLVPVLGWLMLRGRWFTAVLCSALMMLGSMFGVMLSGIVAVTVALALTRLSPLTVPALAWLLVSPWFPPSLLWTIHTNSVLNAEVPSAARPLLAFTLVLAATVLCWLLTRRLDAERRWALLLSCPLILIPVLFQHANIWFIPQPGRYKVEAELAVVLLLALVLAPLIRRAPIWLTALFMIPVLWFSGQQIIEHRRFAKRDLAPQPTADRVERRAAEWISANLPGQRVMLSGSMAAWANAFARVDQLGGISYPTIPNHQQQVAINEVHWSADPIQSIEWFGRFGISAVAVPGPNSQEFWKPYAHPNKFDGVLPVIWKEDDTTIYGIPGSRLVGPSGTIYWRDGDHAAVTARGHVRVAVNAFPGWSASRGAIRPDEHGLMQLDTGCAEPCAVELTYRGSPEAWLLRVVSVLTLVALVWSARQ